MPEDQIPGIEPQDDVPAPPAPLPSAAIAAQALPTRFLRALTGQPGHAVGFAFSPDSRALATVGGTSNVMLWDPYTGGVFRELSGHAGRSLLMAAVRCVAFSPDGQLLASGGTDKTVRLWQAFTGENVATLDGFANAVTEVEFNPAARTIAASDGSAVVLWNLGNGEKQPVPPAPSAASSNVNDIAFKADGSLLAVATGGSKRGVNPIRLVDPTTRQDVYALGEGLTDGGFAAQDVVFSADGRLLAASHRTSIHVWDTANWRLVRTIEFGRFNDVRTLAFSPRGMLAAAEAGSVRIYDPVSGAELARTKIARLKNEPDVKVVGFSPDGRLMAACRSNGLVQIFTSAG